VEEKQQSLPSEEAAKCSICEEGLEEAEDISAGAHRECMEEEEGEGAPAA